MKTKFKDFLRETDNYIDLTSKDHPGLIPGGKADGMDLHDIYMIHKHGKYPDITMEDLEKQIRKGLKVEVEHSDDEDVRLELCFDHLVENPFYYDDPMFSDDIEKMKRNNDKLF